MSKTREEKNAYHREWRRNNKDRVRAHQKKYRANLSDEKKKAILARRRERYAENPEPERRSKRRSARRARKRNPEKYIKIGSEYRAANRGKIRAKVNNRYANDPVYRQRKLDDMKARRRANGILPGMSCPENIVHEVLCDIFGHDDVQRRNRTIVRNPLTGHMLELDFVIARWSLAVEVNGPTHYKDIWKDKPLSVVLARDAEKMRQCERLGVVLEIVVVPDGIDFNRPPHRAKFIDMVKDQFEPRRPGLIAGEMTS